MLSVPGLLNSLYTHCVSQAVPFSNGTTGVVSSLSGASASFSIILDGSMFDERLICFSVAFLSK